MCLGLCGFWPALISKGLRRVRRLVNGLDRLFLACPDFKGIKTTGIAAITSIETFLACPDFKGIKTLRLWRQLGAFYVFLACPDFKGIKTDPASS